MAIPPLAEVAGIYNAALKASQAPTLAVAEHWGRPYSTAGYWVRRARSEGLVVEYDPASLEIVSRRTFAVAQALGVEVQALRDAVIEHADGELRIAKTMHSKARSEEAI
jgi:hypothetical protein